VPRLLYCKVLYGQQLHEALLVVPCCMWPHICYGTQLHDEQHPVLAPVTMLPNTKVGCCWRVGGPGAAVFGCRWWW
jgi:hypothetical protein